MERITKSLFAIYISYKSLVQRRFVVIEEGRWSANNRSFLVPTGDDDRVFRWIRYLKSATRLCYDYCRLGLAWSLPFNFRSWNLIRDIFVVVLLGYSYHRYVPYFQYIIPPTLSKINARTCTWAGAARVKRTAEETSLGFNRPSVFSTSSNSVSFAMFVSPTKPGLMLEMRILFFWK